MRRSTDAKGIVLRPGERFDGVKVFCATMIERRERLGEDVTSWMQAHPENTVTELVVTQSSDSRFHCVSISVFYQ